MILSDNVTCIAMLLSTCCKMQAQLYKPVTRNDRVPVYNCQGANYKKILRLSYDVIITYDNRKSNLR